MIKRDETKLVVIAHFTAKEGKEQELLAALHALMGPTHQEKGCIRYELNQDVSNPRIFSFVEKFADQQAFEAHKGMPYIDRLFDNIIPNLVESKAISLHKEVLP